MKIITFIYIFALYILFIPGILIKGKGLGLLSSLLYSILLYFTLDVIDGIQKEPLEQKMEDESINIRFKNIAGDSPGRQKEMAEYLINAYANLYKIQVNIEHLKKQLNAYDGTDKQFEILQNLYNNIELTYERFKSRLARYDNLEERTMQILDEINVLEVEKEKLQDRYNACQLKQGPSTGALLEKKIAIETMNKSILNVNKNKDILNGYTIEMQGKIPQMRSNYNHMQNVCRLNEGFESSIEVTGANSLVDFTDNLTDKINVKYENDISHIPTNFQTGNQFIKVLQSTSPSAMEELKLKEQIFNYQGENKKIDELREKITKLNDETYQMQNILTNYETRNNKLLKLKDEKVSTDTSITNLNNQLSICDEILKSNKNYITQKEKDIALLKEKQLGVEKAYNEDNAYYMSLLNKYNLLQNNITNYNCST